MRARRLLFSATLLLTGVGSAACDQMLGDEGGDQAAARESSPAQRPAASKRSRAISIDCGFLVRLPFRRSTDVTPPQLLDQLGAEDRFRKVVVSASCSDLASVGSPAAFFDISSRAMLEHIGATKTGEQTIELQGRSGMEFRAHIAADKPTPGIPWSGAQDVRLRTYLSGKRAYQLVVVQAADNADNDEVAADFFDSFEFRADAPPASPVPTWTRHVVGDFAVEAPGEPKPQDRGLDQATHDVEFEHEDGRTGYAFRIWTDAVTSRRDTENSRLDVFFDLVFKTEHSEIVSRKHVKHADWPALDVTYHQNLPVPDSIVPADPAARKAFEDAIANKKPGDHLRLVLIGDTIVELRARIGERDDRVRWFMESLEAAHTKE